MGTGSTILFWHDRWCEGAPLRDLFASLYTLPENKEATMAAYCDNVSGRAFGHLFLFVMP